ncbi:MAG: hypothetical protein A3H91_17020 [Gammaproteobacteria bacterium RIFCSPLOWO2_02_FULL_61_13]|nr:MAG: hypothetical protein A3H91_17020 [Gammaproteobacteria bacterium RIFCSPLOWO2_02_FULL_61_13]HLA41574.1 c-type cytochrome [Candidatus Glassbacteria bacterium]
MNLRYLWLLLLPAACSTTRNPLGNFEPVEAITIIEAPAAQASPADAGIVEHGRYLVGLLGCESCHTDRALLGTPRMDRQLAGSDVGIAYSNPLKQPRPGVVYPANLTPDMKSGIGAWTDQEIIAAIRTGLDRSGRQHLPVMPWPGYQKLSDADAAAITAYLRALPPVEHAVPENVQPGSAAHAPYVHFGVYQSQH